MTKGSSETLTITDATAPVVQVISGPIVAGPLNTPNGTAKQYTTTITAVEAGMACLEIADANSTVELDFRVVPRQFVLTIGGGYDLFSYRNITYTNQQSSLTIAPLPPAGTTSVNRVVATQLQNTPGYLAGMVHVRITDGTGGTNAWLSLGLAQNSQGPIYGLSLSFAQDLVFFTVGVHTEQSQQLLPGYYPNAIVAPGIAVAQTVNAPRIFVSLTADTALLSCFAASGCTLSTPAPSASH